MRAAVTIAKNLKLLLRSRETAYTIVAGPLLIILLVSFAFMGSSDDYSIRVGVSAPQGLALGEGTVTALNAHGYRVSVYADEAGCEQSVRDGGTHACVAFGEPAEEGGTIPVRFHVDRSRLNLVDKIVQDLSGVLQGQADAIREQLASDAAMRMESAAQLLDEAVAATTVASSDVDNASTSLTQASDALPGLPNSSGNTSDLRQLEGYQQGLAANVRAIATNADTSFDNALSTIRKLQSECGDCPQSLTTEAENLKDEIQQTQRTMRSISEVTTKDQLAQADLLLEYVIEDVERFSAEIGNATAAGAAIGSGVTGASAQLATSARSLRLATARIAYARDTLRGNSVNTQQLTAPVLASVVSVASTDNRLSFAYPYLLMLVIMLIGMLLSSTLIVTDKTSRAAFRTFTTPVSDAESIALALVTSVLILGAETLAILLLSVPFVAQPLLNDPASTVLILGVGILLFTAMGMIIGYLARTQEAAMIACLTVGSVLLFVSNLVIPIEGLASLTRGLAAANPYIALSELLKRSMLYGVGVKEVLGQLAWVIVALLVLLGAAAWIQASLKRRYFRQDAGLLAAQHVPAPLRLGEWHVHGPAELIDALDRMTRSEFESIVTQEDNPIARWAIDELRQPRLARGLRTKSKERMILWLDTWMRKHGKKLTR